MGRIRVLLLVKGLGVGGVERLLERSIPYLDRDRYTYHVAYVLPWKDALAGAFRSASIPVHCLGVRSLADPRAAVRLLALLRRERIDLIHAHQPLPAVLARLLKRAAGVHRMVYTEHNVPARYHPITRVLNAATYPSNDIVIAVSHEVARRVGRYVRGGRPRLVTLPNALDVDALEVGRSARAAVRAEFGFSPDARLVVNVANLTRKKGHRQLFAAARRVVDREPRARFLVVGQGPLAAPLAQDVRRLGLEDHVRLTGFRPDAARLMAAADVFVLSSLHEGLPLALLEAMALGCPVVATSVGGVPEIVTTGETGVLVPPQDADALARGLLELLQGAGLRARLGEGARKAVRERHGMAQAVAAVEGIYAALAGARPAVQAVRETGEARAVSSS